MKGSARTWSFVLAVGLMAMTVSFQGCGSDDSAGYSGAECRLKPDPRQDYARYVRFRPGDGQQVALNPPRFSWPYVPGIVFKDGRVPAGEPLRDDQADGRTRPRVFEARV